MSCLFRIFFCVKCGTYEQSWTNHSTRLRNYVKGNHIFMIFHTPSHSISMQLWLSFKRVQTFLQFLHFPLNSPHFLQCWICRCWKFVYQAIAEVVANIPLYIRCHFCCIINSKILLSWPSDVCLKLWFSFRFGTFHESNYFEEMIFLCSNNLFIIL